MADNQLRRIDVDFGDDDPFAELKQIMGLDQPKAAGTPNVAPKADEPARAVVAASVARVPEPAYAQPAAASDDYSIDLEEELLAGFRSELDAAVPAARAETAPATIDLDSWVARTFEPQTRPAPAAPAAEPVQVKPIVVEPVRTAPFEPVEFETAEFRRAADTLAATELAEAFAIDLDDDFAAEVAQAVTQKVPEQPVAAVQPFADFVTKPAGEAELDLDAALAAEFEAELAAQALPAAATTPSTAPEAAHRFAPEADPLDDFAIDPAELEFDHSELMRDLDDVLAALPASEPAVEQAAAMAPAAVDPVQQEIDLDFDVAMAEVDMEFGAGTAEPYEPDFSLDDLAIEDPAPRAEYSAEANDDQRYAAYDDDAALRGVEPAAVAAPAEPELSFEDELKALLARPVVPAVLASGYDAPPLDVSMHHGETATSAYDDGPDWDVAEPETAAPVAYREQDDLQAGAAPVDDRYSRIDAEFEDVLNSMRNPAVPAAAVAQPAHADEMTAFDDHAFDAAFEDALAGSADSQDDFDLAPAEPAPVSPVHPLQREIAAYYEKGNAAPADGRANRAHAANAPQVETIDVPEAGVAVTDELDIPELSREDDVRPVPSYDDFEPDFSEIFNEPAEAARAATAAPSGSGQRLRDDVAEYETALATTAAATAAIRAAAAPQPAEWEPDYDAEAAEAWQADGRQADGRAVIEQAPEFDDFDDQFAASAEYEEPEAYEPEPAPARRGYVIAAVVGGIALLGAAGAFALSFGGDSMTSGPAVVKADSEPIKVRPENPGGTTAPNADNKVFESMSGAGDSTPPAQERLNPSSEEPVDITARNIELAPAEEDVADPAPVALAPAEPTGKGEDRVAPDPVAEKTADSMEVAAVQPRRVKTMVVRSDGTLVPREDPIEAAPAASETVQPSALQPAVPTPQAKPVDERAPEAAVAVEPAAPAEAIVPAEPDTRAVEAPAKPAETGMPSVGPLADARPADQPVDIVGEVAPERVATVAPAGGWSVQIASQPNEEAAQSTYADLSRRYASVIGGKQASIVKAEIQGKGTFWRVRIAAASRSEAINLCENYKSAGGSCFVSK